MSQLTTTLVIDDLQRTPDVILARGRALAQTAEDREQAHRDVRNHEAGMLDDICNEADDAGKPRYSNEAKRQVELARRKASDLAAIAYAARLKETEHNLTQARLEYEHARDHFNSLRSIAALLAKEG